VCPAATADEMQQAIESALARSAEVDARRIIVEANGDSVTLWGSVQSAAQREAAEQAAWSAPGVRDVSNHVMVEAHAAVASS